MRRVINLAGLVGRTPCSGTRPVRPQIGRHRCFPLVVASASERQRIAICAREELQYSLRMSCLCRNNYLGVRLIWRVRARLRYATIGSRFFSRKSHLDLHPSGRLQCCCSCYSAGSDLAELPWGESSWATGEQRVSREMLATLTLKIHAAR